MSIAKVDKVRLSFVEFYISRVTNVSHLSPKCHLLCVHADLHKRVYKRSYHSSVTYITFDHYMCFHRKSSISRATCTTERRETIPRTQPTHPSRAQQRRSTRKTNALPTHPQARNGASPRENPNAAERSAAGDASRQGRS